TTTGERLRITRCSFISRARSFSGPRICGLRQTTAASEWIRRATGTRSEAGKISSARVTCGPPGTWKLRISTKVHMSTRVAMRRTRTSLRRWSASREVAYTPTNNVLVVFDRVRTTDPSLKKVWLLHGVGKPSVSAIERGRDVGHGGTGYANAATFTYEDGGGQLRVHSLLPREREVIARGGPGWEFWTPGDEFGGAWGSGKNWPLDPAAGGPLPTDPYLRKMWKTFWGDDFEKLLPSNTRAVVPATWRVEVSPAKPAREDFFLHVLEI